MVTLSGKSRKLKACRVLVRYLLARVLFKNAGPGITVGVTAEHEQAEEYMPSAWWNNNPVIAAHNIYISRGGIRNDG